MISSGILEEHRQGKYEMVCWVVFNVIFNTAKMPNEWRWSTIVLLYNNRSDIQSCNNYRDIKLLSYTMKV